MKNIKSQGQVISTILLILLVLVIITGLIAFVIPFVRDKFKEKDCFDYGGKILIKNDPAYTCFDDTGPTDILNIRILVGELEEEFVPYREIKVIVKKDGNNEDFIIKEGLISPPVVSYDGSPTDLPDRLEERTYNITLVNGHPESVNIYPILNDDRKCSQAFDTMTSIPVCS
ncbi:hypothetical protein GOV12_04930 [Candidatus Pacearchaeota archaeon]|nr:hypothetical protein [Candidatus Pacearchaeota archaeon]